MARPSLNGNRKYKLLTQLLSLPRPYVRGLLETLWDTANEDGNPILGAPQLVEAAAEWPGEPGALCSALASAGFIDEVDGSWEIHDYWDHAPDYVKRRRKRELLRKEEGRKLRDNDRNAVQRPASDRPVTSQRSTNVATPAPAPAPTPTPSDTDSSSADDERRDFDAFWAVCPRKAAKADALKAWKQTRKARPPIAELLDRLEAQTLAAEWETRKKFCPLPATWLRGERWEDDPTELGEGGKPQELPVGMDQERYDRYEKLFG